MWTAPLKRDIIYIKTKKSVIIKKALALFNNYISKSKEYNNDKLKLYKIVRFSCSAPMNYFCCGGVSVSVTAYCIA